MEMFTWDFIRNAHFFWFMIYFIVSISFGCILSLLLYSILFPMICMWHEFTDWWDNKQRMKLVNERYEMAKKDQEEEDDKIDKLIDEYDSQYGKNLT